MAADYLSTAAKRTHFGAGSSSKLADFAKPHRRLAVFTTTDETRHAGLIESLQGGADEIEIVRHSGEPSVEDAETGAKRLAAANSECVVAIGGGSIIDLAKAASALAANEGGALRYLEVVGEGRELDNDPLPVIAVPTTFGTGSEVTMNAVLTVADQQRKVSLRDSRLMPQTAVIDPDLAAGLPHAIAASSGIDALIHVCEAYVCNSPCKELEQRSRAAIHAGFSCLARMVVSPSAQCRSTMAEVSLCGGLCIASAKLGAVHGIAGVIGGLGVAGHGAICGALFAAAFEINLAALPSDNPAYQRYAELAQEAHSGAAAEDLPAIISELAATIGLASLSELGVPASMHPWIAAAAQKSSSMRGNPVELSTAQLEELLAKAH